MTRWGDALRNYEQRVDHGVRKQIADHVARYDPDVTCRKSILPTIYCNCCFRGTVEAARAP